MRKDEVLQSKVPVNPIARGGGGLGIRLIWWKARTLEKHTDRAALPINIGVPRRVHHDPTRIHSKPVLQVLAVVGLALI